MWATYFLIGYPISFSFQHCEVGIINFILQMKELRHKDVKHLVHSHMEEEGRAWVCSVLSEPLSFSHTSVTPVSTHTNSYHTLSVPLGEESFQQRKKVSLFPSFLL